MTRRSARTASRRAPPPAASRRPARFALHAAPDAPGALDRGLSRLAWALLGALALGLLLVALGPHRIGDYFTETDFYGAYAEGARLVQQGRLEPARYGVVGPGYEVALGLVGFAIRDLFQAAELVSVVSMVAGAGLWFLVLRRLGGVRLACLALAFLVTNPILFRYGYSATTDALAWALQAASLAILFLRRSPRGALVAGVLAAAAFLTRYSAIALVPAGLAAVLGGVAGPPRRARGLALFLAGFALPVAPWVLYSLAHGGSFTFQLHHNIAYEVFARSQGIVWDDYQKTLQPQFGSLWDVIARDPMAVASRMLFNVVDHLRLDARDLLGDPVGVCALLGFALAVFDGTLRRLWAVGLAGLLAFLVLVPAFHSPRYSLAVLPAYAAFAAALFASPRFALVAGRVRLKTALALLPLGWSVAGSWRVQAQALDQLPVEVLDAAATLRAESRPGDRVIARKPHLAWTARMEPLPFPFADSLGDLAAFASRERARWLFVSWPEVETRPRFWYLLDTAAAVPGLTARRVTRPHPSVLYEIGPGFGARPAWMADDTTLTWHTARARLLVNPLDPEGLFYLALVESARDQADSARAHLEQALRVDPRRVPAWLVLGELALRRGDPPAATRAYAAAARLDPASVDAALGLGWASLLAGRPAEAVRLWRPQVPRTRDPNTLRRMIELFTATGDAAGAEEARATLARLGGSP
jgi:tetratricopeptide (TPR) repeat protein